MALEDLLKDLTAAVKELTETTKNLLTLRTEAIEAVKIAAAPTTKATTTKTENKATDKAPEPEVKNAATGVDPKVYEELSGLVAAYVGGATRDEERAARKEWVKKLMQHESIKKPGTPDNVFDTANIKDDAIQAFRDNMDAKTKKGDIIQVAAAGGLLD